MRSPWVRATLLEVWRSGLRQPPASHLSYGKPTSCSTSPPWTRSPLRPMLHTVLWQVGFALNPRSSIPTDTVCRPRPGRVWHGSCSQPADLADSVTYDQACQLSTPSSGQALATDGTPPSPSRPTRRLHVTAAAQCGHSERSFVLRWAHCAGSPPEVPGRSEPPGNGHPPRRVAAPCARSSSGVRLGRSVTQDHVKGVDDPCRRSTSADGSGK